MMQVINPATGKEIRSIEEWSDHKVNSTIDDVYTAWQDWKKVDFSEKALLMKSLANTLHKNKAQLADLMTEEMGKVTKEGVSEIEKCAWACEYHAENAENFLKPTKIETDASLSYVSYQPMGIVLAIMPWNFPFWQVIRFLAPALMAGNVGLLKHASNVPGCAAAIEDLIVEAGFPKNVFKNLPIGGKKVEQVIENPKVKAVTLTGSTEAGKKVASVAGKNLKKTVLELGGSDPYVVLADADIDKAAETCVKSRLINNGQSCIAAKRFIVEQSIIKVFETKVVELMGQKKTGDPKDTASDLGPMARKDLRTTLHEQVQASVNKGAKILIGGKLPTSEGYYYPVTVLTNVSKGMPAYDDELFGPVASIIAAKNESEAIELANDTIFGLGAAIFTKDVKKGERLAERYLDAGCCFVNDFVKSDPRLPFGGIKQSGYGRELGPFGIKEFVNIKTVYVK